MPIFPGVVATWSRTSGVIPMEVVIHGPMLFGSGICLPDGTTDADVLALIRRAMARKAVGDKVMGRKDKEKSDRS